MKRLLLITFALLIILTLQPVIGYVAVFCSAIFYAEGIHSGSGGMGFVYLSLFFAILLNASIIYGAYRLVMKRKNDSSKSP